ncbi:M48 family metallopeptidase [Kocuria sp. ZOR0020]|uniref:M48 metallopeptidase family protein n=1 Tax=Kocuria sp. ZOR0020 TaxID=1339234 RepID=UPI000B03BD8B|nr:M48 family metallopeptidase [Kocuria sp. ZOR0020]
MTRLSPGSDAAGSAVPPVEVQRSARRKRTVSAHWSGETVVLQVPARMSAREVKRWERELVPKLVAKRNLAASQRAAKSGDAHLETRAHELSRRHLKGAVQPSSITWSSRQNTRWGSATPATGTVRISRRLESAPSWVLDAVIFHELCHLLEANHGPAFRRLERRYPRMAEAQAFLDGAAWALGEPGFSEQDQHQ